MVVFASFVAGFYSIVCLIVANSNNLTHIIHITSVISAPLGTGQTPMRSQLQTTTVNPV